ncbi:hypothetical protein LMH73_023850 [Vibrio splendidus]|nr:hypothetical protein [Vibrio splendidus]MCC4883079.1 hypothetical protein [Vibrio splendidus]
MTKNEIATALTQRIQSVFENLIADDALGFTIEEALQSTDQELLFALTVAHATSSISNERRLKMVKRKLKGTIAYLNHIELHGGTATQQEVAEGQGVTVQCINNRIRNSELMTLTQPNGKKVIPLYQFKKHTFDPIPVLKEVNKILLIEHESGCAFGTTFWTSSAHFTHGIPLYSYLSQLEDKAMLKQACEQTITAAHRALGMGH